MIIRTNITISTFMNKVPSLTQVAVKDYISGELIEQATAEQHVEFMRNNCCLCFDRTWEVYGIQVDEGILTVLICPAPDLSEI
jgi:hypothetical protein